VQNNELMRRAVEYARMVGVPLLDHCQDYNLVGNGVVHEGYWSTLLGLPGWPAAGEEGDRDAQHPARRALRSPDSLPAHQLRGSVRLLREARSRAVKISGKFARTTSR
jgi:dihydroorotase